jgi:hypothetical protein
MTTEDRTYSMSALLSFITESNAIEGIYDSPSDEEIAAYIDFRSVERPALEDVMRLVEVVQPGARLRDRPGLNVSVGEHEPPPGGAGIPLALDMLLADDTLTPAALHHRYLFLHPFTDGNGRSARALWLHRRGWDYGRGSFLQEWYYASLMTLDLDHTRAGPR